MIRDQIRQIVTEAVGSAQSSGNLPAVDFPPVEIERPNQADHGDYSSNFALLATSAIKKATGQRANPRQIAQSVVENIPTGGLVGSVELAGPGFINIRLHENWLQQSVLSVLEQGASFGAIDRGKGQRWQVEYVSANPTGPLHYGGGRNAVLGDALANVLEAAGYDVQREFYVNDSGTQFQLFIESLYVCYIQLCEELDGLTKRNLEIPEGGYQGAYLHDYAKLVRERRGDRLAHLEPGEARAELREDGREIVVRDIEDELASMGVTFDRWFSEKSLYDEGLVDQLLEQLSDKGEVIKRDGALWFLASSYPGNEKDEVVVRSNGAPTYFASDIAYHYDKFVRRKFDRVINVWAVDHQGHIPRMGAVMRALELDPERLKILLYNLVKLIRDGQEVKMSKRSGDILTVREVVEEVGPDAVRFMLLTTSPERSIDFDMSLAVQRKNENRVYYVQYGHARICSLLQRAAQSGHQNPEKVPDDAAEIVGLLSDPAELTLIRRMLEMEEQIELAVDRLSPHNLTYYAEDLTKTFSVFYENCQVLHSDVPRDLARARLLLVLAAKTALSRVLNLMGMSAPEEM
ncbi:MAG: arginine--tRNA ligase [Caldilineaceae bacterium SB0668_bin_21]|nr:arginine--tRNA ligase [Caldilineaceae bacterium SB0668_bin_21]MYC20112.1 arginine--tRNA ligase [Caldilineaceae bacterium SB0662_bin_25]